MIKVQVEDYCEHCLDFSPDVTKPERHLTSNDEFVLSDTIIQCQYRKRCAGIKRYLEQQIKTSTVP